MKFDTEVVIRISREDARHLAAVLDDIVSDYDGSAPVDTAKEFIKRLDQETGGR